MSDIVFKENIAVAGGAIWLQDLDSMENIQIVI
jgi:hypothetical protein